jgi:hypothetical protein
MSKASNGLANPFKSLDRICKVLLKFGLDLLQPTTMLVPLMFIGKAAASRFQPCPVIYDCYFPMLPT